MLEEAYSTLQHQRVVATEPLKILLCLKKGAPFQIEKGQSFLIKTLFL